MAKKKSKKTKKSKKVYVKRGVVLKNVLVKKKSKKKSKYGKTGQVGSFGGIVFKVSSKKTLTMQEPKQEVSGRWESHQIIGSKPKPEFLGPDTRSFEMTVIIDVQLGYKPHKILKKINQLCEKGKVDILVIGTHKIGKYKWKLEKASEAFDLLYSGGELARAKVDLTLSEYR